MPALPEGHILYSKALAGTKQFSAAFKAWDHVIEQMPLQMIWLEQAINFALSLGNMQALKRWTSLIATKLGVPLIDDAVYL